MKGADEFMQRIIGRELRILDGFFAHEPDLERLTSGRLD